jgi:hypothetical protein
VSWHRHVWKIVEKTEQPSTIEAYRALGGTITADGAWPHELDALSRKTFVVTSRCEKCGTEKVERL